MILLPLFHLTDQNCLSNLKDGEDARKTNIENFNNIQAITLEDVKNYGNSEYLKSFYYVYATSLDSDTLSKATDTFEYEVEERETTTNSSSSTTGGNFGGGFRRRSSEAAGERRTVINNNTTTVITKRNEKFESSRNLTSDFELDGYSSIEAMTDFVERNISSK